MRRDAMSAQSAGIEAVKDNTLRSQIVQQLRALVIGGRLAPGERLTETHLAERLGVSRAPLREAVRELVDSGILVSRPYRGLFVRPVSAADLQELYSMRINLEQFAFQLGWDLRSDRALADLRRRYQDLVAVQATGEQTAAIAAEIAFHSWIYELTGHRLLQSYWARLSPLLQLYLSLHHKMHGAHGKFAKMTRRYLELAAGDDLAAMRAHIEEHMHQGLMQVIEAVPRAPDGKR